MENSYVRVLSLALLVPALAAAQPSNVVVFDHVSVVELATGVTRTDQRVVVAGAEFPRPVRWPP